MMRLCLWAGRLDSHKKRNPEYCLESCCCQPCRTLTSSAQFGRPIAHIQCWSLIISNMTNAVTSTEVLMRCLDDSEELAEGLRSIIDEPLLDSSPRVKTSEAACALALEHWEAVRALLRLHFISTAVIAHRAQFEAVVRSIWLTYAASDLEVSRLSAPLDVDSERTAKNMAQVKDMLEAIEKRAPPQAYAPLARFKDNSWSALNSYAHAGIHPLRRQIDGYPVSQAHAVLCNANGVAVVTCMQAVMLSGMQPIQKEIVYLATKYPMCMSQPL